MIKNVFTSIKFDGVKTVLRHIQLRKPRNNRIPIIFLSGIGGFAESYMYNFNHFYENGYWPISVDHLGFGASEKPCIIYDISTFSKAIISLIEELRYKSVILVGNSFGGGVSIGVWEVIPHKIKSIILVSSAGYGKELAIKYRFASLPVISDAVVRIIINRYIRINNGYKSWRSIVYDHHKLPKEIIDISDYYKDDHAIRIAYGYILQNFVDYKGQSNKLLHLIRNSSLKMKQSKLPVLIIWGVNDEIIPHTHGVIASHLTSGKLVLFQKCGHMPYIEHIDRFNKTVTDFLNKNKII